MLDEVIKGKNNLKNYIPPMIIGLILSVIFFCMHNIRSNNIHNVIKQNKTNTTNINNTHDNTILYKESNAYINNSNEEKEKTPEDQKQIRTEVIKLLDENDNQSVYKVFDKIYSLGLKQNCHSLAHDIGHEAYKMYRFQKAMDFENTILSNRLQYVCAGGYLHGLLEEAAEDNKNIENNPEELCLSVENNFKDSCYHGLGHALMYSFDNDTRKSVEYCSKIENRFLKMRCSEGVWMEYYFGNGEKDFEKIKFDFDNIGIECNTTEEFAKPACYLYSAFAYLRISRNDYKGALKMCNNYEDLNKSSFCFKGVGLAISHSKFERFEDSEILINGYFKINKKAFYQGFFGYAELSGYTKRELSESCKLFKNPEDSKICKEINS